MHHVDELLTFLSLPGVFLHFSTPACKVFLFTETVGCLVSSWLVVAMAMERLLVVYRPFKKNVLCTQKGAIVVITSLFVIFSYTQVSGCFGGYRWVGVGEVAGRAVGVSVGTGGWGKGWRGVW